MLALEVALLSDPGGRKYNEDACGHWHSENQLCCVLADGAGGHGGGDVASRLTVQELIGRFASRPTADGAALGRLLRETNEALIDQREPGTARADMHSTVVCLVIDFVGHRVHWAHAGDSRMYWFRGRRLHNRTRDHSLVQSLVDAGMLAEGEVRQHPKRSELRSALGLAPEMLEVSSGDGGDGVDPGDIFLLCTDGLWEYVDDSTLEATLAESSTPREWLDALASQVLRAAAHKSSHDNFSALVVWTDQA
ncbi:MAG: serine/threonine-protein phosphatase [Burkholderiales bacterium]|nr:serine/threonine-protein phosphatase [Burkholderiales bacterium]MDE2397065.1 serine/threonine-protein phosphatase [Burkholderiales bacterium]MDE2453840.1 serine/threonine-protein phosphatase [Burkholderiales bacterium]